MVITTTFREGARRVIGATAKPLYAIDGKAGGLDRRPPRPPSSREGDRRSGGRSKRIARPSTFRAISKILYNPRVQGRNPARFNGGYGVPRGFKGEKSKSPPNPLGLAERIPSSADDDSPFPKWQQYNPQLQMHLMVAISRNPVMVTNSFHRLRAVPLPR